MPLDIDGLDAAARLVRAAVSRDKKQPPALRCILVDGDGDLVRVVATDRHRLVVAELAGSVTGRHLLDPDTLEPAAGVTDEFPDYQRFLAADPEVSSATVDSGALRDAVEAAADDDAPLAVQLVDGDVRVGDEAAEPTLHVDARYLHDALDAAGTGKVVIEASSDRAPLVVRAPRVVTLVMPVRVRN